VWRQLHNMSIKSLIGVFFSWRLVDCDARRDALRYLQDDQLKRRSREQHVLFICFTLRQAVFHVFPNPRNDELDSSW